MAGTRRSVGRLAAIHRYPVKSMMGEALESAIVTPTGVLGDRAYALVDLETGKVASAKNPRRWPTLFSFDAAFVEPPQPDQPQPGVRIRVPDGRSLGSDEAGIDEALSAAVGRSVRLATRAPAAPALEEYWPDIAGLDYRDVVTDEAMPEGTFFDVGVVHVLTTGTLDTLGSRYPEGRFDVRRFRPNLVVETDGTQDPFPENEWVGNELAIGEEVVLRVERPCGRCVMTTLAQGELPKDPGILRAAARYNAASVGVYASVIRSGVVSGGMTVQV